MHSTAQWLCPVSSPTGRIYSVTHSSSEPTVGLLEVPPVSAAGVEEIFAGLKCRERHPSVETRAAPSQGEEPTEPGQGLGLSQFGLVRTIPDVSTRGPS